MIVVTGAAGFIGSNLLAALEHAHRGPLIAVDWLGSGCKWRNIAKRRLAGVVLPEDLPAFLGTNAETITHVIHLGAISDTTERDADRLVQNNIRTAVMLWDWCAATRTPFLYASSGSVYGSESAFRDEDDPEALAALRPLNPYGWSKQTIDYIFADRYARGLPSPPLWLGLRFFNVYGPNEYHKGNMSSVVHQFFKQTIGGSSLQLFRSYDPSFADGEQRRDFVTIDDCTRVVIWLVDHARTSGIVNIGTGQSRSFLDVARAIGAAQGRTPDVQFIDMPEDLRGQYQYHTEADIGKLRRWGFGGPFTTLERGIADYLAYLGRDDPYR